MSDYVTAPEGWKSSVQYLGRENRFLCSEAERQQVGGTPTPSVLGRASETGKDGKGVKYRTMFHTKTFDCEVLLLGNDQPFYSTFLRP